MGLSRSLSKSSIQIQAWPVLQTRPNPKCRAPHTDRRTYRAVGVSRDRQRFRRLLSCLPASKPDFPTPSSQFLRAGHLSHCPQKGRLDVQAASLTFNPIENTSARLENPTVFETEPLFFPVSLSFARFDPPSTPLSTKPTNSSP